MSCWLLSSPCRLAIGVCEYVAGRDGVCRHRRSLLRFRASLVCLFPFVSSLRMYNGLVERCFMSCVDTFRRKTLEKNEEVVRKRCSLCKESETDCMLRRVAGQLFIVR